MKSIEIDDQVFMELARRAVGFRVTENDVLRHVLNLPSESLQLHAATNPPSFSVPSTLIEFIKSERFQRRHQAVDRYLGVLGWLNNADAKKFTEAILNFHRGTRTYFAKSEDEILKSGGGVTAKSIPQSSFWALTTLDNKSKRLVLEDILQTLDYSRSDINLVIAELPDSDIRRSHSRRQFYK